MRFRRLTLEELTLLEKDFVYFLAYNSITASDWEAMKAAQDVKVEELILEFSDFVIEKSLKSIKTIESKTNDSWIIASVKEEQINLLSIFSNNKEVVDFTNSSHVLQVINDPHELPAGIVTVSKRDKAYSMNREDEVYSLLKSGFSITDSLVFDYFNRLIP